ncbi:MAG: PAS domain-containing protein [Phycisphaerae bacterium]
MGKTNGHDRSPRQHRDTIDLLTYRQRWQVLAEMISEVVAIFDAEGVYRYMNPEAARRLGGVPENYIGRHLHEVLPGLRQDEGILSSIREVLATGRSKRHEAYLEVRGRRRWYRTDLHPLHEGQPEPQLVLAIAHDATPLREARERLEAKEQQYRELIQTIPVGITRVRYEGGKPHLEIVNPAVMRLLGVDRPQETADFSVDKLHARQEDYETLIRTLHEEGFIDGFECEMVARGHRFWISLTAHAKFDQQGGIEYVDSLVQDITQRKLAQDALRNAHARLLNAREEERRHLAGELHDSLGQRLVALQLGLRSLKNTVHGKDDAKRLAAALAVTGEECSEMIREVRHICHGLYPPALESMGLAGALKQLTRAASTTGLALEMRCSDQIQEKSLGRNVEIALFRIAQEAINNAVRHGGAELVEITLKRAGEELVMTVIDNGAGFEPEEASRRGLGLRLMQERVDAIGATLELSSCQGQSAVHVRVPWELTGGEEAAPRPEE